jgi:hypothetical protein
VRDNFTFTDEIGNGCERFARFHAAGIPMCNAQIIAACPIACGVTRRCPNQVASDRVFKRTQLLACVNAPRSVGLSVDRLTQGPDSMSHAQAAGSVQYATRPGTNG